MTYENINSSLIKIFVGKRENEKCIPNIGSVTKKM